MMFAAMLMCVAGCKADESPIPLPTEATVVGTYNLKIVNGGQLPFPFSATAASRVDLIAGQIVVNADHTFSDQLTFRRTYFAGGTDPDQVSTLTGTWGLEESTLMLTYSGHPPVPAVITEKLLNRNDQGLALTYSK
jgi:hypothetical protein